MELTLSKRSLSIVAVVILAGIGIYSLAARFGVLGMDLSSLDPRAWFMADENTAEAPALKAVETVFSSTEDQAQWEATICYNMTEQGCTIFKSIYAKPLWEMQRDGAVISFVDVVDELEDGTEVWLLNTVRPDGATLPVYIHTGRNEAGEWLLIRILFDQEARKYEQK